MFELLGGVLHDSYVQGNAKSVRFSESLEFEKFRGHAYMILAKKGFH